MGVELGEKLIIDLVPEEGSLEVESLPTYWVICEEIDSLLEIGDFKLRAQIGLIVVSIFDYQVMVATMEVQLVKSVVDITKAICGNLEGTIFPPTWVKLEWGVEVKQLGLLIEL